MLLRREQRRSAELAALAEELRHEREKQAEVAVAAERTRISRELHDAVAHTVSAMTLQVGVVRRRLGSARVEEETTPRCRDARPPGGRRAAPDRRPRCARASRPRLPPLPSLAQLGRAGHPGPRHRHLASTVEVTGPVAEVPQAVDMSAYRIVQEGLTNALRHAPARRVEVRVVVGPATSRSSIEQRPRPQAGRRLDRWRPRPRRHPRAGARAGRRRSPPSATPGGGHRLHARLPLTQHDRGGDMTIRVVLVDDEAMVRAGLRLLIDGEDGPRGRRRGDRRRGRRRRRGEQPRPDVVLMDVRMPRMNGLDAARAGAGRRRRPGVLVLTTFDEDDVVDEALRRGVSGFLLKARRPGHGRRDPPVAAGGRSARPRRRTAGSSRRFAARRHRGAPTPRSRALTGASRRAAPGRPRPAPTQRSRRSSTSARPPSRPTSPAVLAKLGLRDRRAASRRSAYDSGHDHVPGECYDLAATTR